MIAAGIETSSIFGGAAIAISAVALLGSIYGWRFRRLVLRLKDFAGQAPDLAVVYDKDRKCSAWVRLRVRNRDGRLPAIGTEVTIIGVERASETRPPDLEKIEESREWTLTPHHEGLLIGYSLKWAERPRCQLDIAGGTERLVDVVYLPKERHKRHLRFPTWEEEDWWELRDQPERRRHRPDDRHHVYWPAYRLSVSLTCVDAKPVYYTMQIQWDGVWPEEDQDIGKHLSITAIRRHRRWPTRRVASS